MKRTNAGWSFDSRDLMRSSCDHCTRLAVGRELGIPGLSELLASYYRPPTGLPIRYGILFEEALESELRQNLGDLVQRPAQTRHEDTVELMRQGVPVIYQGALRGGTAEITFSGRPDFLLRGDYRFHFGESGLTAVRVVGSESESRSESASHSYSAWDAKLSSNAKPEYQNQVALYCDVLADIQLLSQAPSGLLLGNRSLSEFSAADLLESLAAPRSRLLERIRQLTGPDAPGSIAALGELVCDRPSGCDICEYPDLCRAERLRLDHLQLVANITSSQIAKLRASGVQTMSSLASLTPTDQGYDERLVRQAKTQVLSSQGAPYVEVTNPQLLANLPKLTPHDIFFDIEGFTFAPPGGIEYLLGWVTADGSRPKFFGLWSDDRRSERRNFQRFVRFLLKRHRSNPDFKVYHYAGYEKTALRRLAKRYGVLAAEVDLLISSGVFVDLYEVVLRALCVGQPRYSIKNLEHYYSFERSSPVKEAMGSMEFYDAYLTALRENRRQAKTLKRQVLDYNRDDCVSTLALRYWLLELSERQPKP